MDRVQFVRKTTLDGLEQLGTADGPAVERHAELRALLVERSGSAAADLFAEPVLTRGNGAVPSTASWYAPVSGDPVPLAALDGGARQRAEDALAQQLAALAPLLDDAVVAPLLGPALHISQAEDILVANDRPILTNWALLPPAAAADDTARHRHFEATLGRFAPFAAPPLAGDAAAGPAAGPGVAVPGAAAAALPERDNRPGGLLPPGGLPAGGAPDGGVSAADRETAARRPWLGVAIATGIATLLLLFLLLPGVLLYPPEPEAEAEPDYERLIALQREVNRSLEEQVARTEAALGAGACRIEDGTLVLPAEVPAQDLPAGPLPADLVPARPEEHGVPQDARPERSTFQGSLVELLDASTALVVAGTADAASVGSGFFIGDDLLLTNKHVVADAEAERVFVTSPALGGLKQATVVAATEEHQPGGPDFAVLQVPGSDRVMPLTLTSDVSRLQNVIAAGYPSLVLKSDLNFQALTAGDRSAIPDMVLTQGVVTVVQNQNAGFPIVAHTAGISPGSSGGPLVDACGRVVGVNTFGRFDEQRASQVNYAIATENLIGFLEGAGIGFARMAGDCTPVAVAGAASAAVSATDRAGEGRAAPAVEPPPVEPPPAEPEAGTGDAAPAAPAEAP